MHGDLLSRQAVGLPRKLSLYSGGSLAGTEGNSTTLCRQSGPLRIDLNGSPVPQGLPGSRFTKSRKVPLGNPGAREHMPIRPVARIGHLDMRAQAKVPSARRTDTP